MSDCYRHPNGYIIFCQPDGSIERIESPSGEYAYIPEDEADTLRDYFLNELGLWHDEETGALVVTSSWDGDSARVLLPSVGVGYGYIRPNRYTDRFDKAVIHWRATLAPPPREPV